MKFKISKQWIMKRAKLERGCSVEAGDPSVIRALRNRRPTKRVRSGEVVVVRRSSANSLLGQWEIWRNACIKQGNMEERANALDTCIQDLRRLLARPSKRQPQHNP